MLRLPPCEARFPTSIAEAVELKAKYGPEASYVAGGTDLYPNMKRRQQTPYHLIDVRRIPELGRLEVDADGGLIVGACVTLTRLIRDEHAAAWPVLGQAAATISTPILQNMGTVGGNLLLDTRCNYYDQTLEWRKAIGYCMKKDGEVCWVATASKKCLAVSSTDTAPALLSLGARVNLVSTQGERMVELADLYNNDGIDYIKRRPDEILSQILIDSSAG
ncbi:MAG: FAD binding domain-containing protein, partial [Gemmatimonadetes bacterium]|nr:FAD binding domain-containing protein [Gemmatimonadota bacterium]